MTGPTQTEPPILVGIDVGSQSVRAMLFDARGRVLSTASRPTPTLTPQPGRTEYDPEALWQAALGSLAEAVTAGPDRGSIAGISVASIGETAVPLDKTGRPTSTAIAWFDGRARPQAVRIAETLGEDRVFAVTGHRIDPIFGLCKLLWMKESEPDAYRATRHWLNVADWIVYRLCGEMATDASLASRTLAYDVRRRCWSAQMLEPFDVPIDLFAPLKASGSPAGTLRPDLARTLGLAGQPPIVGVGGHDHVIGAVAAGAGRPGVLLDSIGTAEALFLATPDPVVDRLVLERGYPQGVLEVDRPLSYLLAGLHSAGGTVEWFRTGVADGAAIDRLIAEAASVEPGAGGAWFIPHLRHSQNPYPDDIARGAFLGLTEHVRRGGLFRAVLEGLAMEARLSVDGMLDLPSVAPLSEIRVIGGGARNELHLRIKASVYGLPLRVSLLSDRTCQGAALLGGIAAGVYADLDEAVAAQDDEARIVEPVPEWTERYADLYDRCYRSFYRLLRPINETIDRN